MKRKDITYVLSHAFYKLIHVCSEEKTSYEWLRYQFYTISYND